MEGANLSVPLSPIRPVICTQGIHKSNEASGSIPERERCTTDNLPGRYSDTQRRPTQTKFPAVFDQGVVSGTGSGDKRGKVPVPTYTGNSVSRFSNLDKDNDYFPASGQDQKYSSRGKKTVGKEDSQCEGPSGVRREDHGRETSNSGGPFVSSTPAGTDKQHHFTPDYRGNVRGLQAGSGIIRRCQERIEMVGSGSSEVEFNPNIPSSARPNYRDRCLSDRMGSHMQGSPLRGFVVPGGAKDAYQCTGATGCNSCSEELCQGGKEHQHSDKNGQQNNSGLCQSLRRDTFQRAEQSINGSLDVGHAEEHFPDGMW